MKVSVVVPAFNEEALLAGSLASIREALGAFSSAGWQSELVVCDNNSTDRTAEIARAQGARVVFEPVNQIARARNAGAAAATGDWLIFVDADSWPSRALFEDARRAMEGGRCLAGGATVSYEDPGLAAGLAIRAWNVVSRVNRWAAGSFMFCEAAALREAGGFNEALFASEEIDLYRRLKQLARRRGESIVILHRHPLHTSGRKLKLYGWGEMAGFLLRTVWSGGRTLRSRKDCFAWYDGRR